MWEITRSYLDHQLINDIAPFDSENPTAENLAKHIYHEVAQKLPDLIEIDEVTVWESENYGIIYKES